VTRLLRASSRPRPTRGGRAGAAEDAVSLLALAPSFLLGVWDPSKPRVQLSGSVTKLVSELGSGAKQPCLVAPFRLYFGGAQGRRGSASEVAQEETQTQSSSRVALRQ
jgi:hypothetical protein